MTREQIIKEAEKAAKEKFPELGKLDRIVFKHGVIFALDRIDTTKKTTQEKPSVTITATNNINSINNSDSTDNIPYMELTEDIKKFVDSKLGRKPFLSHNTITNEYKIKIPDYIPTMPPSQNMMWHNYFDIASLKEAKAIIDAWYLGTYNTLKEKKKRENINAAWEEIEI